MKKEAKAAGKSPSTPILCASQHTLGLISIILAPRGLYPTSRLFAFSGSRPGVPQFKGGTGEHRTPPHLRRQDQG